METNNRKADKIRIHKAEIHLGMNIFEGKDGDFYVHIAPAFDISGYGRTPQEALESFNENIKVFCEDLMALSVSNREAELMKLGFKKEFFNKNFSKLYIDNDGVLQGLDPDTVNSKFVEETIAA